MRASQRHAMFPYGVEVLAVLAWIGLYLLSTLVPHPLVLGSMFLVGAVGIGAFLAWGIPDPDYGTTMGKFALLRGGGKVIPRVSFVSMCVGFLLALLLPGLVWLLVVPPLGALLSFIGGVLGRRARA